MDVFMRARRVQMEEYSCPLVELAKRLNLTIKDLLRDAADDGLRIFARPDVRPTVVHINRNLLAVAAPYRSGRTYTPRTSFKPVSTDNQPDEGSADEPKKVPVRSVQSPACMDQPMVEPDVEGFFLKRAHCSELLTQNSAYVKTFDQVLVKSQRGWLQPFRPLIRQGHFLGEALAPKAEWTFAAYDKAREIRFTPGVGYPDPDGFSVRLGHLFVTDVDLEERYARVDTDVSIYVRKYGGLEGFAKSRERHISQKLRLAAQVYLDCWYGNTFESDSEIKAVLDRFKKACEAICDPDLYNPNAKVTDLPDLVENWLTPIEFRKTGVRRHHKVESIPWELQLLLASAELWEAAYKRGDSVKRDQLISFFREQDVDREHATRLATVAGRDRAKHK